MNGLLILLLALNVAMLVAVTVFYRRARKKKQAETRRVEAPNSEYASGYVRDLESRQRWQEMDRSLLHEVNREEFDRVLAKLEATSVRALSDGERAFLDRMLEAERRVRKTLRRDRRADAPAARRDTAGESGGETPPEKGNGNSGGTPRPAHGTS